MINRIICFLVIPCLFLAVFLKASGINEVNMGTPMLNFLNSVDDKFISFKVEIPKINLIPVDEEDGTFAVKLLNAMTFVANFFLTIANVFVGIINVILTIAQWIVAMVWSVVDLIKDIKNTPVPEEPHWPFEDIEFAFIF